MASSNYRELVYVELVEEEDCDPYKFLYSLEPCNKDYSPRTPLQSELENDSSLEIWEVELPEPGFYWLSYSYSSGYDSWSMEWDCDLDCRDFEKAKWYEYEIFKIKIKRIPNKIYWKYLDIKRYFEPIWAVEELGLNKDGEPSLGHYPYQNEYLPVAICHAIYFRFKEDHPARWFESKRKISITSR